MFFLASLVALALPAAGYAATIEVNAATGANTSGCGTAASPCRTIGAGIAAANGNTTTPDVVNVAAGLYTENVGLGPEAGTTLRGPRANTPGRDRTIPASPATQAIAVAANEAIVTAPTPNGTPPDTISSFAFDGTIEGFAITGATDGGGVRLTGGNAARGIVKDNLIYGNTVGIELAGTGHVVRDNWFAGNNRPGATVASGDGIISTETALSTPMPPSQLLTDITIDRNKFTNENASGVDLHGGTSTRVHIINNTFDSPGAGEAASFINALNIADSDISGNVLKNSDGTAVKVAGTNVDIQRNVIDNSLRAGIRFDTYPGETIPVLPSNDIRVRGNKITNNGDEGVDVRSGAFASPRILVIRFNHFFGNGVTGDHKAIRNEDALLHPDATDNFYGCNQGPLNAACDGIGGLAADSYTPWLVLTATASPATVATLPGASTITADFVHDSTGVTVPTAGSFFPSSIVAFSQTGVGTIASPTGTLTNGAATVTDNATTEGKSVVTASLEMANSNATVTFGTPVTPPVDVPPVTPPPVTPPPVTPPPVIKPLDKTPPVTTLSGDRRQKLGSSVSVDLGCSNEACTATANGTVHVPTVRKRAAKTYKLAQVKRTITAGGERTIKLKLSRLVRHRIKAALDAGKTVKVKLTIKVTDAAGNSKTRHFTVKLTA